MKKGDHLVTQRFGYTHHGIYLGNQEVIHYSGFANGLQRGVIEITSYSEFTGGNSCRVKSHLVRVYDAQETIDRAMSRLGEDWYNVLLNNCEHFVNWCIIGLHSSSQVNNLVAGVVRSHALFTAADTARKIADTTIAARVLTTAAGTSATTTTAGLISAIGGSAASAGLVSSTAGGVVLSAAGIAAGTVGAPIVAAGLVIGGIAAAFSFFDW